MFSSEFVGISYIASQFYSPIHQMGESVAAKTSHSSCRPKMARDDVSREQQTRFWLNGVLWTTSLHSA
ncbi:hypothetical protein T265_07371 [Opisthorchis viverrini]|uniref:Uncharacterized protein n=1 Tax=Opisthorchis viverrini TaxID=6198 RepID=A0A074ZPB8_OPIVI|nr:hypothetical protein T265_07371 [Opisthorchis viverrini]KER25150.1 hypothetical protein T265_07371 [Opisthorchis viverrini]